MELQDSCIKSKEMDNANEETKAMEQSTQLLKDSSTASTSAERNSAPPTLPPVIIYDYPDGYVVKERY